MVLYDLKGKLDKIKEHLSNLNLFLYWTLCCMSLLFFTGFLLVGLSHPHLLNKSYTSGLEIMAGMITPLGISCIGVYLGEEYDWDLDDLHDPYDDPSVLIFIVNSAYIILLWVSWMSGWFIWHKFLTFYGIITGILIVYTLVFLGISLYLYLKERSYKKLGESKEYKRILPVITEICDRWDNGSEGYDKSKVINGLNAVYNGGKLEDEIELSKKVITVFKYVFTYGITPDPPQITDYISGSPIKVYGSNITTTTTTLAPWEPIYEVGNLAYYRDNASNYGTPTPKFSPDPKSQGEDHYSKYLSLSTSLYEVTDALNTSQSILAKGEGNTARISKALQKLLVAVRFICDSVMDLETFDKVSSKVYNDEESLDSLNLIFTEFNKDIKEIKKDVEERSKKLKEQQEQLKQQRESLLDKSFKNKTRGLDQYTKNMRDKHE